MRERPRAAPAAREVRPGSESRQRPRCRLFSFDTSPMSLSSLLASATPGTTLGRLPIEHTDRARCGQRAHRRRESDEIDSPRRGVSEGSGSPHSQKSQAPRIGTPGRDSGAPPGAPYSCDVISRRCRSQPRRRWFGTRCYSNRCPLGKPHRRRHRQPDRCLRGRRRSNILRR